MRSAQIQHQLSTSPVSVRRWRLVDKIRDSTGLAEAPLCPGHKQLLIFIFEPLTFIPFNKLKGHERSPEHTPLPHLGAERRFYYAKWQLPHVNLSMSHIHV